VGGKHVSIFLVGTSGYSYRHWKSGVFYPKGTPERIWFEFYAQHFSTVELNVSFYRLPRKETFAKWHARSPEGFVFAVKGSRFITHVKRLAGCDEPVRLFAEHAGQLKEKLAVILWQLPPSFKADHKRLELFCNLLLSLPVTRKVRHVFEFREASWFERDALNLLKKYNFSLCLAHSPELPYTEEETADFTYLRFHGGEVFHSGSYSHRELNVWASKIRAWLEASKDVYAYFNNDVHGYAVKNALTLRQQVLSS
jgi:uncharacterized protein YecE (DUF72 family)